MSGHAVGFNKLLSNSCLIWNASIQSGQMVFRMSGTVCWLPLQLQNPENSEVDLSVTFYWRLQVLNKLLWNDLDEMVIFLTYFPIKILFVT